VLSFLSLRVAIHHARDTVAFMHYVTMLKFQEINYQYINTNTSYEILEMTVSFLDAFIS